MREDEDAAERRQTIEEPRGALTPDAMEVVAKAVEVEDIPVVSSRESRAKALSLDQRGPGAGKALGLDPESGLELPIERLRQMVPLDHAYEAVQRLGDCFHKGESYITISHCWYDSPWGAIVSP